MVCLVRKDGTISRKQEKILQMQAEFYSELCRSDVNIDFEITEHNGYKLTEEEKRAIEVDLTIEELYNSLKSLRKCYIVGLGLNCKFIDLLFNR